MTHRTRVAGGVVAMAALLAALTAAAPAGTADLAGRADPFAAAGTALAADHRDAVDAYLDPTGADLPMGWQAIQAAWLQTAEVIAQAAPPSVMVPGAAEGPARPVTTPAGFAFPEAVARAAAGADTGNVPYQNTALLGLAPGGFGRVILGQRSKGGEDWVHSGKTALSYIRPNVNVQMMLAFQAAGTGGFEGPGFDSRALLSIANRTRVDSAELGTRTDSFGYLAGPPLESDEPQATLAVGLDLGILPTFLAQMGLSVSIVASRGAQSGDLTVALVGTTELPVDWIPRERPEQHPTGIGVDPLAGLAGETFELQSSQVGGQYRGGGGGGAGGGGGENPITPVTPITPVIPEPATAALVGSALALAALRRRASR